MDLIRAEMYQSKKRNQNWKYCVGTGRLGLALQEEYVKHLKQVQEDIGFRYIRGHGLFHDDIGIYQEVEIDGVMQPFYNFTYIDRIFDMLLELKLKPFIELGFMPSKLASGMQTVFYWKGNVTPPKDYQKWAELIRTTIEHFIDRYGLGEVLTWPFEVWNEPNLTGFWENADQQEYFKLYQITAETIKKIHPDLQVGGPAICGGSDHWVDAFLGFCRDENVPVDFFSRHAYTSRPPEKTPDYYYQELEPPEDMLEQFKSVRKQIEASGYPSLPFHITEFNTSYSPINPIHDTLLNAAYLAKILVEAGDLVNSFSYWTFSDVFEESGVPKSLFHGGFGMIAFHQIPKPTYHLYHFFNQLGETEHFRNDQLLITQKQDGTVVVLAWNLIMEKGSNFNKTVSFQLPFGTNKPIFKQRKRVTEQFGNAWNVWKQLGRPRFPTQQQIEFIKQAAVPIIETEQLLSDDLTESIVLEKNEVTLLSYIPITDETATYPLLNDRQLTSY
ncbi:GH39 family glycosyl hydrolase [Amphibacillus jilinensis]|uniref:GH39 family glycosyl hydrolase n=1 Tax=Amphibacillus jilinensis TaxID=1216008 RepID=UPI003B9694FD